MVEFLWVGFVEFGDLFETFGEDKFGDVSVDEVAYDEDRGYYDGWLEFVEFLLMACMVGVCVGWCWEND